MDPSRSELIPISEVPDHLPKRRGGKAVHLSTVYRWIHKGAAGRRLEAIKFGGLVYTSREALDRFGVPVTGSSSRAARPVIPGKAGKILDQAKIGGKWKKPA